MIVNVIEPVGIVLTPNGNVSRSGKTVLKYIQEAIDNGLDVEIIGR